VKVWPLAIAAVLAGSLPGAAARAEPAPIRIGVVLNSLENPFWVTVFEGVRAESRRLGVRVSVRAPANRASPSAQAVELRALIREPQDCYAVAPITATNLVSALQGVRRPLVVVNSPIEPASARKLHLPIRTFVGTDDFEAGKLAGARMAAVLRDRGEVALFGGWVGNSNSTLRLRGFERGLRGSGVRVVERVNANYERTEAEIAAMRVLRTHPQLSGIFAANDLMALGVAAAVRAENRTGKVTIIGLDGITEALAATRSRIISATVARYPYVIGQMAVDACVTAIRGATSPKRVIAPIALVTASNVDRASASFPRPFRPYSNPFDRILRRRR
jgi:ribose transport system substrate-binding protein